MKSLITYVYERGKFAIEDARARALAVGKDMVRAWATSPRPSLLLAFLFISLFLCPSDLWAHTGDLLKDEIEKLEKLFTGGYMRLGLLGVCGFAAVYGIVKQNGWTFASGILGCVFAYFMKDWVTKTFTAVI